ncbi:conserved exported hypothetical protein [Paraburkholderia sacchari]|uniref:DUF6013 family protein n=1 Tax=Paraburkholderia sacchari TaxID=159450 RepID=UPI00054417B0|nr:DUF6013 family protein [Paraburkholderia sacchari]
MPCSSSSRPSRTRAALVRVAVALSCAIALPALASPPIKVTSKTPPDGPIRYTVKVTSKLYGNSQETRTLRSGDTDDFTWRTTPPGGAVPAAQSCPDYASLPLDANGAMVRQTQVRLAPIVAADGTANVQVSFRAQAPRTGKSAAGAQCPEVVAHSEVLHFSMPTNGTAKTLTLSDGTQLSVSAQR